MLILNLLPVNVVLVLHIGTISGGLAGGLSLTGTITSFTDGLGARDSIELSYALLGGFAATNSKTGIPELLVTSIHKLIIKDGDAEKTGVAKTLIILALLLMAVYL